MAGIPSGRVSPFAYGMVPGYDAGTANTSQRGPEVPSFVSAPRQLAPSFAGPGMSVVPVYQPPATIPNFAGSGVHLNPQAATVAQAPVPQTDAPAGLLAPKSVAAPASAVPSDPMIAARSWLASTLMQQRDPRVIQMLMGGLPRQPMPQETAQNSLLYMAAKQHADETSADALKGLTPDQQKVATINATEKLRRTLESISNANYGALNYEQQGFGLPGTH